MKTATLLIIVWLAGVDAGLIIMGSAFTHVPLIALAGAIIFNGCMLVVVVASSATIK